MKTLLVIGGAVGPFGSLSYFDGKFYGMTTNGGAHDLGVIFEWNPATNVVTRKFDFDGANGSRPFGSLTYGGGKFCGMTSSGGASSYGVIFEWDPIANTFTKEMDFDGNTGAGAYSAMTYHDGKFYGMVSALGGGNGVLFEWNPLTKVYTKKVIFSPDYNGTFPSCILAFSGGKFYGTTSGGGDNRLGVLFEWDPSINLYKKKVDFSALTGGTPRLTQLIEVVNAPLPTIPASNISFTDILSNSMRVSFKPGNGARHLAIMKAGAPPTFQPTNNIGYSGNLGNGDSVVYNDIGSAFNLTHLQPDTEYFITIFEFNEDSTSIQYLTDNAPLASQRTLINSIEDFSLTYFKSGTVVSNFSDMITLDMANPDIEKYTIRANVTSANVRSVEFAMDGIKTNIENVQPYDIKHSVLRVLNKGVHILSAQAYSKRKAQGNSDEKKEVYITVINSSAVMQFDIVNKLGIKIRSLSDGETIDVSRPEFKDFNIIARTNMDRVRSVKFELNGNLTRIDNHAPFGVSGTAKGHERPWQIGPGYYTLTATPFMKNDAFGTPGIPFTAQFTIINNAAPALMALSDESLLVSEQVIEGGPYDLSSRQLFIYPVPVKDELHISLNGAIKGTLTINVMDINGRSLYTREGKDEVFQGFTISTNELGLSSGLYIICIQNQSGRVLRKRFLKE